MNPRLSNRKRPPPPLAWHVTPGSSTQRHRGSSLSTPIAQRQFPVMELFQLPTSTADVVVPAATHSNMLDPLRLFDYSPFDNSKSAVEGMCNHFETKINEAIINKTIQPFKVDDRTYSCWICGECGARIFSKKSNATRHCTTTGHDVTRLFQRHNFLKLRCGQFVAPEEVQQVFRDTSRRTYEQRDYQTATDILSPYLQEKEKRIHSYTHHFEPLISKCVSAAGFEKKIRDDSKAIHDAADPSTEVLLINIHECAERWLMGHATQNILQVPGDIRAALQTFEGGEVNEISQNTTYVMQFFVKNLVPEVKSLLSFAYRRGLFSKAPFDQTDPFAVSYFLKDLLLEEPGSVGDTPFLAEYCLMSVFRVHKQNQNITMISCGTLSSTISRLMSACRAAFCSVVCSFTEKYCKLGRELVQKIQSAPVLHILSPMVRQIRDMSTRVPSSRKTSQDQDGNIYVDQYSFGIDTWSAIVSKVLDMMKASVVLLVDTDSWEKVADYKEPLLVDRDLVTGELSFRDKTINWKEEVNPGIVDRLCALIELSLHGFGGGSARGSELGRPSMFHALWHGGTIYYGCESIKIFNGKLPPSIARFFLIFRSLARAQTSVFETDHLNMLPKIKGTKVNSANLIKEIFNLDCPMREMGIRSKTK